MSAASRTEVPHLFAGLVALGIAAVALFAAQRILVHLENATIVSTAPEDFALKNQGLAFQRAAVDAANVLPIYGSSELLVPASPYRGNIFFRTAPTGFQLSPVGGGGTTPLIILQKVGALGSELRGKKIAISLSPNWFFATKPGWRAYAGNFSSIAATEMVFGSALDFDLKRKIASRMLECPSTLEQRPLLNFALRRLASGGWRNRILFCAVWPAGKVQSLLLELQDHLTALHYIRYRLKSAPQLHSEMIDWSQLVAKASKTKPSDAGRIENASTFNRQIPPASRDAAFKNGINRSPAWVDLELLLRALASARAQPLILSMPVPGEFYDQAGVSRSARDDYYTKLRALVQRYHFSVVEFQEHDEDTPFLIRHASHLTAKGWAYYDRTLDDFFHGRLPRS
jgi:D-alanine transfer protein